VKAPVGIGNVEGMILEAPFPSDLSAPERFDLLFVARTGSIELFGADFGAVVFAITLFLCEKIFSYSPRGLVALFGHTKKTKHGLRKMEVSRPALCGGFHAPRGIGESLAPVATSVKEPFLAGLTALTKVAGGACLRSRFRSYRAGSLIGCAPERTLSNCAGPSSICEQFSNVQPSNVA
jgi:hypothetical protein